ncbi:MAG: outer membrane protein assembly factor BamE [Paracoccaceae bacterium]
MGGITSKLRLGIVALAITAMSGCVAGYRNHGYIPDDEDLDAIVVGVDTRASVEDNVGSPSSAALLNEGGFYYVRTRVKNFAYRAPEIVDRQVLAISFDDVGVVTNIEKFGLQDGRVVALDRRVTESSVVDRTFLRQLLGGFGRIAGAGR